MKPCTAARTNFTGASTILVLTDANVDRIFTSLMGNAEVRTLSARPQKHNSLGFNTVFSSPLLTARFLYPIRNRD